MPTGGRGLLLLLLGFARGIMPLDLPLIYYIPARLSTPPAQFFFIPAKPLFYWGFCEFSPQRTIPQKNFFA